MTAVVSKVNLFLCFISCLPIYAYKVSPSVGSPLEVSLYKYEGNFYPTYLTENKSFGLFEVLASKLSATKYLTPVYLNQQIYHKFRDANRSTGNETGNSEYEEPTAEKHLPVISSKGKSIESGAAYDNNLKINSMSHEKKNSSLDKRNAPHQRDDLTSSRLPARVDGVTRHYHDIFLKLKSPQDVVFGHVLNWPEEAQKKIEKRTGNHFRGQVIWADKTGGHGEHYWDLAQGAL